jgi:hypothetical protein
MVVGPDMTYEAWAEGVEGTAELADRLAKVEQSFRQVPFGGSSW